MGKTAAKRIVPVDEAARRLGISPRSLIDKRFRMRAGLPAVKIGARRIGFDERDIERLIQRGRERLPDEGRRRVNVSRTRCCAGIDVRLSAKLTLDLSTLCFLLRLIGSALRSSYCNEGVRAYLLCSGCEPNG
jgi:predicted DNA-binding transcriptional regulator AlpA